MKKIISIILCLTLVFTLHVVITSQPVEAKRQKVVCINAGHQEKANNQKEAIGPGSKKKKTKVAAGTVGKYSKKRESKVNLEVALLLRKELEKRGYKVIMTRTSQNVNLSNQQRAKFGNKADITISLHCDDSGNRKVHGASTICIQKNNPYHKKLYSKSRKLASRVLNAYCKETKMKKIGISYRNDLTGLNWSSVPAIYIEMGYMSNRSDDKKLASTSFQKKCAKGIAKGVSQYFK